MYLAEAYTFTPGPAGQGTIEIPETLQLEDFGIITNVTRNSVLYNPAEGDAGATLTSGPGSVTLTLEQTTSYCSADDHLQIIILKSPSGGGGGGGATEAKQDTQILQIEGIGNLLTTIDGDTSSIEAKLPALSGGAIPVTGPLTDAQLRASSLPLPSGAATSANQTTTNATLSSIDSKTPVLNNGAVPVSPNVQQGSGAITATTTRVTLATDGPGVANLASIDSKLPIPRTPTTTSVASSATSVTILAANSNRRGVMVMNDSTAILRLSFSTPATTANSFVAIPASSFLMLDQNLIGTGAIYGIWASANGTAQVTEWV